MSQNEKTLAANSTTITSKALMNKPVKSVNDVVVGTVKSDTLFIPTSNLQRIEAVVQTAPNKVIKIDKDFNKTDLIFPIVTGLVIVLFEKLWWEKRREREKDLRLLKKAHVTAHYNLVATYHLYKYDQDRKVTEKDQMNQKSFKLIWSHPRDFDEEALVLIDEYSKQAAGSFPLYKGWNECLHGIQLIKLAKNDINELFDQNNPDPKQLKQSRYKELWDGDPQKNTRGASFMIKRLFISSAYLYYEAILTAIHKLDKNYLSNSDFKNQEIYKKYFETKEDIENEKI